jgi:HEAT repeat protein
MMGNPSDFVDRLIQPFWSYFWKSQYQVMFRLSLAAKCIGANDRISTETQQKVIEQLTKIIQVWELKKKPGLLKSLAFPIFYEEPKAFQALGETKSEKAADLLGEFLESSNSNHFCQCAVNALRNAPLTEKAQNSLVCAALRHEDGVVRKYATEILGENMSQEVESKLVQVLNDGQETARRSALFTLRGGYDLGSFHNLSTKRNYSDEVICAIIKVALEDAGDLGNDAVCTLAAYGGVDKEERIINPLIHALLTNPDANIRTNAAYALFWYSTPHVRKALIQALDDGSAKVRTRSAYAFVWVGIDTEEEENEASRKLLSLFSDEDNTVRQNAIVAYGRIRRNPADEELSHLINLLRDENISVRYSAANALGFLKASIALDALKQMVLEEKYADPKSSAIWAVLQIEPSFSEVIKENGWEYPYITMLSDDDIDKRKRAAKVLRRIGTEITLPFLKVMDEDYEKRRDLGTELFYAIRDIEERVNK